MKDWPTANYDNAHDEKYGTPFKVPLVKATPESLKEYGIICTDFENEKIEITPWPTTGWRKLYPGTGSMGGTLSGEFTFYWKGDTCRTTNKAAGWDFTTGRVPKGGDAKNPRSVLVREASYHPDGGQLFFPKDGKNFVLMLALPGDDVKPENFVAFYFDGSFGVQIHANIWHQPVCSVGEGAQLLTKQGAVHACVTIDFVEELGKFVEVPLVFE
ncbi:hypothetical protein FSP39_002848 [Pinctada imbricata]|uniref:Ureidoglycolate hydrolase n=1 Tax=Pinctada imbricata TaxID=66713 RepID=A0AA88XKY0_PINIB|nr:hypothetical protein FSP39_002848 [Pinctada imbricata]